MKFSFALATLLASSSSASRSNLRPQVSSSSNTKTKVASRRHGYLPKSRRMIASRHNAKLLNRKLQHNNGDRSGVALKECTPRQHQQQVDIGVLGCGHGQFCMESSSSSLGGVCQPIARSHLVHLPNTLTHVHGNRKGRRGRARALEDGMSDPEGDGKVDDIGDESNGEYSYGPGEYSNMPGNYGDLPGYTEALPGMYDANYVDGNNYADFPADGYNTDTLTFLCMDRGSGGLEGEAPPCACEDVDAEAMTGTATCTYPSYCNPSNIPYDYFGLGSICNSDATQPEVCYGFQYRIDVQANLTTIANCYQFTAPSTAEFCYSFSQGPDSEDGGNGFFDSCEIEFNGVTCNSCAFVQNNTELDGCMDFDCTNTALGVMGNNCVIESSKEGPGDFGAVVANTPFGAALRQFCV